MFDFNFNEVIADIDQFTFFEIANERRPDNRYLLANLLPETLLNDYNVESGSMQITPTMAGLAAESSPYPKGGHVSVSKFLEKSAKIANEVALGEGQLRKLQAFVQKIRANQNSPRSFLINEVLNFYDKVILQPHFDAMEYLRGKALFNGSIAWNYGNQKLEVDYGIPTGNFLPVASGTEAYHGSASTFWDDIRKVRETLRFNIRAMIAHPTTIYSIIGNSANNIEVLSDDGGIFRIRRVLDNGARPSQDSRDMVTLVSYGESGEVVDPNNTDQTITLDFAPTGKILVVAQNSRSNYRVGEGATDDPRYERALGYTHIAPTVEGGGVAGRWGRTFTPEQRPWQLVGQAVTNGLPVIEAADKVAVLETEMP